MAAACNGGLHSAELHSAVLAELKTLVGEELKVKLGLRLRTYQFTTDACHMVALQLKCWHGCYRAP